MHLPALQGVVFLLHQQNENKKHNAMKTFIFSAALALLLFTAVNASNDGTISSSKTKVYVFQNNTESVDIYLSKNSDESVKIRIETEAGDALLKKSVEQDGNRYFRYHLNELPEGKYLVKIEQAGKVISSTTISRN